MLHPFTLQPIFKQRVWGGRALASLYQKDLPPDMPVGESWEIADRSPDVNLITNGPHAGRSLRWLMEDHPQELLGEATGNGGRFPLLVKLLDAQQVLSLQVHPPTNRARALGGEPKTELWYVSHAAPGAEVLAGFHSPIDRASFGKLLATGNAGPAIHRLPVQAGDALFLPSGRVHALGAGCVIFEIQQNSDTTYRVYDWNRPGVDGQPRELHIEAALASIDFDDLRPALVQTPWTEHTGRRQRELTANPLFRVLEWEVGADPVDLQGPNRPLVVGVIHGDIRIAHAASGELVHARAGSFALVPASARNSVLSGPGARVLVAEPGAGR